MNTTHPLRKLGFALCLIGGLAASGSGFAQGVEISNAVYREVEVKAPDGSVEKKLVELERAVPGEEVIYEIAYSNDGADTATEIVIDNPLPEEVVFVSASVDPTVVSVDGGKEFGALSDLTVTGPDGQVRKARAADITNLRWVVATLGGGASGKLTYRVQVK